MTGPADPVPDPPPGPPPGPPPDPPPGPGAEHRHAVRVHYEDTDMGGIVYHANYLKFCERARSDWVRGLGIDQGAMREGGTVFAVTAVEARFRAPARFDDVLEVATRMLERGGARIVLRQDVSRGGTVLYESRVTLAAIGPGGRPARLPAALRG